VVDGNFSAEHMKMRKPGGDVRLVNGEGYVVEEEAYRTHLSSAIETKQVFKSNFNFKKAKLTAAHRLPIAATLKQSTRRT
jgi:hypothetical protein